MVIDPSALVAILLREPEADRFLDALDAAINSILISPVSIFEAVAAVVRVTSCSVVEAREAVRFALEEYNITRTEISSAVGDEAITAFERFGKILNSTRADHTPCFPSQLFDPDWRCQGRLFRLERRACPVKS